MDHFTNGNHKRVFGGLKAKKEDEHNFKQIF
jgi:hypothetical protein